MYLKIKVLCNVNPEDLTMVMKRLSREAVRFAVNIHKSDHIVIGTVIFVYTLESLCF